jgi:hypothetical protein
LKLPFLFYFFCSAILKIAMPMIAFNEQDYIGGNLGAGLGMTPMLAIIALGEAFYWDNKVGSTDRTSDNARSTRFVMLALAIVSALGVVVDPIKSNNTQGLVPEAVRDRWSKMHLLFALGFFGMLFVYIVTSAATSLKMGSLQKLGVALQAISLFSLLLTSSKLHILTRGNGNVVITSEVESLMNNPLNHTNIGMISQDTATTVPFPAANATGLISQDVQDGLFALGEYFFVVTFPISIIARYSPADFERFTTIMLNSNGPSEIFDKSTEIEEEQTILNDDNGREVVPTK